MANINIFDRTCKIMIRDYPLLFLRLATGEESIRLVGTQENVEINLPQQPVDFVHRIEFEGREYLLHIEFQLRHEADFPQRMFVYSAHLTAQFEMPVISLVLYLMPRKSLPPQSYEVQLGGLLTNHFHYPVLMLSDYEREIRNGTLRELAPLLVLLVENPSQQTLAEERQLILQESDPDKRARLLASAVTVGSRYFETELLWRIFREEVEQMRQVSFIEQWIHDAEEEAGRKGLERGALQAYKDSVTCLLEDKFAVVQAKVLDQLDKIYRVESLKSLIRQAPKVSTQAEFLNLINRAINE